MKIATLLWLTLFCLFSCTHPTEPTNDASAGAWWKTGVVYQIYPRSFKDSNGDGVGDLRGIIQELDYIKSLGIDIVWLNPIYSSPNDDNGYDISDYENIMTEFGTMADFDELLQGFHARGIKPVMDLVVNHSSDEHDWFKQSRASRDNPYRNFYHWWPAERRAALPPRLFDVNGEAWLYDTLSNAYYLHYFGRKQPDLNWENEATRKEIYAMMHRWFKKGVDGFRMDVIPFISKDTTWPAITEEDLARRFKGDWAMYYASGPNLHAYLQEMNREVLSHYNVMALGEGAGVTIDQALNFVAEDRNELDLFFHFDGQGLGYSSLGYRRMKPEGWTLAEFKDVYSRWSDVFAEKRLGSIYLGNHDQPRMVSRWGNDSPEFWLPSASSLHTFLLSMRATPFIYHGDEIGMTNLRLDNIADYRDIETLERYSFLSEKGENLAPYLEDWKLSARENGRSPFQWNTSANGGFTTGTPWLKVNSNYATINAAAQENDPNSILQYFRKMIALRKKHPALIYGAYKLVQPDHQQVYAYTRSLDSEKLLVLLNFSTKTATIDLPGELAGGQPLINNYPVCAVQAGSVVLQPYQAVIFTLK